MALTVSFKESKRYSKSKLMLFLEIILTRICLHGVTTGSPSSKYEHWRTSALLRDIRNIRICMGKNGDVRRCLYFELGLPVVSPKLSNVTRA